MVQPVKVFISYSATDINFRKELEKHLSPLARQGFIKTWSDGEIVPGTFWKEETFQRLKESEVVILLVSSDFLSSDQCFGTEMRVALDRHRRSEIIVLPIIIRPSYWEGTPLNGFRVLPDNGIPISLWDNPDIPFLDIVQALSEIINNENGLRIQVDDSDDTKSTCDITDLDLDDSVIIDPDDSIILDTDDNTDCFLIDTLDFSEASPGGALTKELIDGHPYSLVLLWIDVASLTTLGDRVTDTLEEMYSEKLREFIFECISQYGGDELFWDHCGGVYAFWGDDRHEKAIMGGMHLFDISPNFDHENERDYLECRSTLRILAKEEYLVFNKDLECVLELHEKNVFFEMLERNVTKGEFCVVSRIYDKLPKAISKSFIYFRKTNNVALYHCGYAREDSKPQWGKLKDLVEVMSSQKGMILGLIKNELTNKEEEFMRSKIDSFYLSLDRFASYLFNADVKSLDNESLIQMGYYVNLILGEEDELQLQLRSFIRSQAKGQMPSRLKVIIRLVSGRRPLCVTKIGRFREIMHRESQRVNLKKGLEQIQKELDTPTFSLKRIEDDLEKWIRKLLKADEVDVNFVFSQILDKYRLELSEFLLIRSNRYHKRVAHKLWRIADQILLDDIGHSPQIFLRLATPPVEDKRFSLVWRFLQSKKPISLRTLKQIPETLTETASPINRIIIFLKCMIVGHSDPSFVNRIINLMPLAHLWSIIIHPKISIPRLLCILSRFSSGDDSEDVKIFFDCIRSNLVNFIDKAHSHNDFFLVKEFILQLFEFDFFVEDLYFERLDDILKRFKDLENRINVDADIFGKQFAELSAFRRKQNYPISSVPKKLSSVPLGVQRYLARSGVYLDYFAIHNDSRIAREVIPHITKENIAHFLRFRSINAVLLRALLNKKYLFRSKDSLNLALNHPKCTSSYARYALKGLSFFEISRISGNSLANSEVRKRASIEALNHAQCTKAFAEREMQKLPLVEVRKIYLSNRANHKVRIIARSYLESKNPRSLQ